MVIPMPATEITLQTIDQEGVAAQFHCQARVDGRPVFDTTFSDPENIAETMRIAGAEVQRELELKRPAGDPDEPAG